MAQSPSAVDVKQEPESTPIPPNEPSTVEAVPEISGWLKAGANMFNHFKNDANASITLIDSSGREFLTRLRTSDFQYLIKQTILANVKAQLEKSKSIFHRDLNTDSELAATRLPSSSTSWLASKSSRSRISLEENDDSQPGSEGSSSSTGSTYNLAAKLKLFERKSDEPSTSREKHGSAAAASKGSLHKPGIRAGVGRTAESSNGKIRGRGGKRRIQPMPTFHNTVTTVPFKLQCDEVLALDEEMTTLSSQPGSGAQVGSAASSLGEISIRVTKTTPSDRTAENGPQRIKKRRNNKNGVAGMKKAETAMPPKLKLGGLRKSRGRGNRCRKMYGISRRDLWCKSCQWKKRCSRFDEDGNVIEGQDEALASSANTFGLV
ncbi:uncharacterized protein LOC129585793 isoform X1 [Paramacrobiotus metropolitanus]|uniref:uncharacterized protein LOC129585793 isoform X1 n=1 Tax=Paramacrobiotus metropolitanus TaxID=2943436 RepID=UPI002445F302|nr:uncharacterized protein LOC129585793 isoform X1 [Paramacrobiotus metropolitanus]